MCSQHESKKSTDENIIWTPQSDQLSATNCLSVHSTTSLLKPAVSNPVAVSVNGVLNDPAGFSNHHSSTDSITIAASVESNCVASPVVEELSEQLQFSRVSAWLHPSCGENLGKPVNKALHRQNRLDAVDLTRNSNRDAFGETPVEYSTKAMEGVSTARTVEDVGINSSNPLAALSAPPAAAAARVKPSTTKRCEIYPVPGRVSAEGVRIGSSHACPVCSKQFTTPALLAMHTNIHYLKQRARCAICRATFASNSLLASHRLAEHQDANSGADSPRRYRCDDCGRAFRIPGHLAKHRRSKMHAARVEGLTHESSTLEDENSESACDHGVSSVEQNRRDADESSESVDGSVADRAAAVDVVPPLTVEADSLPTENGIIRRFSAYKFSVFNLFDSVDIDACLYADSRLHPVWSKRSDSIKLNVNSC